MLEAYFKTSRIKEEAGDEEQIRLSIILLEGFNKIKIQNKLLPIPRLLYASTTPSVRTYTKVWSDLAESYPSKSTIYKNNIQSTINNYQQKVKQRITEGLLYRLRHFNRIYSK